METSNIFKALYKVYFYLIFIVFADNFCCLLTISCGCLFQNGNMWLLFIYIIGGLFYVRCDSEITLTTATVRPSTSAKPTTLYRRINVERSIQEPSSTPLDLLRQRDYENDDEKKSVYVLGLFISIYIRVSCN